MQDNNSRKLRRKVRNSYIISTVSISMVLFLLASVCYMIISAIGATDRMKESMTVYVMLKNGLSQEQKDAVGKKLFGTENVLEALFVPKEKAAEEFRNYIGVDFTEFLDFNPLPDSYEVRMRAGYADNTAVTELEKNASSWPEVEEVVYQSNVAEKIFSNINKFNLVLMIFGAALLVISIILLNNTIRISIYSKRYIINTMKLVGADRRFVIRPFVNSALLQGVYSALIATVMFAGLVAGIGEGLPELRNVTGNAALLWITAGIFVVGITISLIFTIFAVDKFIRMRSDAVYLY